MEKMELEIKILDINKEEFIKKLESLQAVKKEETKQYLYTYDLPTIYGRYIDLLTQLNEPESQIKYETSLSKLKLLFFELDNLLSEEERKQAEEIICSKSFTELMTKPNLLEILNQENVIQFIKKFHNNSKKWIRVRETNGKATIAVKHILANNNTNFEQLRETEIDVPSIKEANELLEALGFSYKSYQEKERMTYLLDGYEIDIDSWPGIPTYFEIEGNSKEELEPILNRLGYSYEETISCTADQVYEKYGKSMFDKRTLKFEDYN